MNRKGFEKDLRAYLSDEYDIKRVMEIWDRNNVHVKDDYSAVKSVSVITFTPEEVERAICDHFEIVPQDLYFDSPEQYFARLKKIYAYLLYRYAKMKIVAIAFHVKRSHSVVGRNINHVKEELKNNRGTANDVRAIVSLLTNMVVIEN